MAAALLQSMNSLPAALAAGRVRPQFLDAATTVNNQRGSSLFESAGKVKLNDNTKNRPD
jgi:hypothetical protein